MAPKKASSGKQASSKKPGVLVPDGDHIVFGDSDKKSKKKKDKAPVQEESPGPSKPTARQVVGGASWTGKLPVNLLSEFCQRQKWNKPDYSMRQIPGKSGADKLYRSEVTLSKTDPKTKEVTKVPTFRLPASDAHLADQPSALEARHFAATYALFRVQSMKNLHMTLPPTFRDLWKGDFARMKKEDQVNDHGWKYDEDPFSAEEKRQDILRSIEKRKQDERKKEEDLAKNPDTLTLFRPSDRSKKWESAPQVEMGQQTRVHIEQIIRAHALWNPFNLSMPKRHKGQILADISGLGFRPSHVEEALDQCQDHQEVLEWLLVHVPEEDLPRWTFPPNYSAGVSLASGDLVKEAKLKKLAAAGYQPDVCAQALQCSGGDYRTALFHLQHLLVPKTTSRITNEENSSALWDEEMQTIKAIFGENCHIGQLECSIHMSTTTELSFTVRFTSPGHGYPFTTVPAVCLEISEIPAYIRLSATKKVIEYARAELSGEVMIYNICQWLETELPGIIESPGRLSELCMSSSPSLANYEHHKFGKQDLTMRVSHKDRSNPRSRSDRRSDLEVREHWKSRQSSHEQDKMMSVRHKLPAWKKRNEILHAIAGKQVTIVSGETGSGKSTQVVQFVLDQAIDSLEGAQTNILCTQPRRVATISLADRVSHERCSKVGDEVGYMIRGESRVSDRTKITFMTTGVLLRRLQSLGKTSAALEGASHIFVDEVHERSLDTDFLLALLKDCLESQPKLKIVLMSATLDADVFSRYFGGPTMVALVSIEGRTFPVEDLYLEDFLGHTRPELEIEDIGKAVQKLGFGINYDLIQDVVQQIDHKLGSQEGSILIFLPGTLEIERCLKAVTEIPGTYGLPLHASLLPAEQRKVFLSAPAGRRKVVAATNVAETSITIEDIVAVIDSGRVKETNYDTVNNIVRLQEVWASQAACKQRRGRAGRVRAGICYKLFTRSMEAKMSARNLPEIQRTPLEQLCLSVKATGQDRDVSKFLSQTLTPPDSGAVANAIRVLHTMGALENNKLTALGTYLAMIPADLRCAKLLVYGTLFDCLEPCLTIASILTVRSPFVSPRDRRDEANEARSAFSGTHGDLILDLTAYEEWVDASQRLRHREVQDWCSRHFVSHQILKDIFSTRRQIIDSLKEAQLIPFEYRSESAASSSVDNVQQMLLLRALIAASLQPQIALISFPSKKYISSISGAKELDPEAKTIKYFVPQENTDDSIASRGSATTSPTKSKPTEPEQPAIEAAQVKTNSDEQLPPLSRIFIHPSSILFTAQSFSNHATHISYFTRVMTSKPFIRDLTPLNIYTLLLFGGRLKMDTSGLGLLVGDTWRVRGWARIGVLISRLRVLLDEELRKTVEEGGVLLRSMNGSDIVKVVRKLIVLNGQDQ